MKLLGNHPYYASSSNYYDDKQTNEFEDFAAFYEEYKDADIDMNLIIRFDVSPKDEDDLTEGYSLQVIMIMQRKGIYRPCLIKNFTEEDEKLAIPLLEKHWQRIKENWAGISGEAFTPDSN